MTAPFLVHAVIDCGDIYDCNGLFLKGDNQMKVILTAINAKYIHSCLAVYSLRANAGEFKEDIQIKEFTINHRVEEILRDIYHAKPDILAFSCYIWNIEYVKKLIVEISKLLPQTQIWLGGPEVSYNAREILEDYDMVRLIMKGEGEATFYRLLESHSEEIKSLEDIKGITYKSPCGKIIENQMNEILDLKGLEFAYTDLDEFDNRIIYYEASRGCPFSCSYCLSSIDKKLRFRGLNNVKKELGFFLDNNIKQVKFVDRTFNANKEYAMSIWNYIIESDNGVTNFHFEISADILDDEQLELLSKMRKGLVQFEIGVQSTNEKTIDEIDRRMDINKVRKRVSQIKTLNSIHQHLDLIAGLPFEDYKSFSKSFNDVYYMYPDQLQLGFLKVLQGSKMYDNAGEYGIVYSSSAPYEILFSKWLNYEEICKLKDIEEVVEDFYNSGQFTNTILCLERLFDNPFAMYEKLSEFINKRDRFVKHSRINNYKILFEFIKDIDSGKEEIFGEVLIYDLYLREKIKSRPEFAKDLQPFKDEIKDFYQRESSEFNYLVGYSDYRWKQIANMTHIEVFSRDIMQYVENGIDSESKTYVLFDYKGKDTLTKEANVIKVKI